MAREFMMFGKMGAVMNVCPRVTRREVIERAGFRHRPTDGPADGQDFVIECVYGSGQEYANVEPGEKLEMQMSGASIMVKNYGEKGLVFFDPEQDETTLRIAGIEKAIEFYNYRGDQQLALSGMQLTEEEMRRLRGEHRGLYVNRVREQILQEELERLLGKGSLDEEPAKEPVRNPGEKYKKHRGGGRWDIYEDGKDKPIVTMLTGPEAEAYLGGTTT